MSIVRKIKRAVRGEVAVKAAALETLRRGSAAIANRRERANLQDREHQRAHLRLPFDGFSSTELLHHFKTRTSPVFVPGFSSGNTATLQKTYFASETGKLLARAESVIAHRWPLLGLGEQDLGTDINWHKDPLSEFVWPQDFHADINLIRGDGSDVRLLWELNRLPQLITLARAFAISNDERFSIEFFSQLESWRAQNPVGWGVNWSCAMEVALRAMNLLAAFEIFRRSSTLDVLKLQALLAVLDQHGTFIKRNLEFSYIATSNHYLSDVVGLVWLGVMMPELQDATEWRDFGLREMLREMDKQVLDDGADFEASTGYHRFVVELFLYTFILCRANAIQIETRYWNKLHDMLRYIAAYLRPDGRAPLIGDTDNGQVLPVCEREGDDHSYLLTIGATAFNDPDLKPGDSISEELLWFLGEDGVHGYQKLVAGERYLCSKAFPEAGTYVLRDRDLYLFFNTSGAGINGRGSHGHNDVLSIEVSAGGRPFIVDPGTYVYTADLNERHKFRSTAYHSTVEIDRQEQNTTDVNAPFVIGNEAQARVLVWETTAETDRVSAEHKGYARLEKPTTHRRTITFDKSNRWWLVEDELFGEGEHDIRTRFHFDSGLEVRLSGENSVEARDRETGLRLIIRPLGVTQPAELEDQFTSRNYGHKSESITACWSKRSTVPREFKWALIPIFSDETEESIRARVIEPLVAQGLLSGDARL